MAATMTFSDRMMARMAKRTQEVAVVVVPQVVKPIERASEEERETARGRRTRIEWQEAFEVILARQVAQFGVSATGVLMMP